MAEVHLDQALPIIRHLALRKANAFVRRFGLPIDEREDVESQLLLTFIARWPKFNSNRASVQTFASRVMDSELITMLRFRLAHKRQPCEVQTFDVGHAAASTLQFRIDVERAVSPLPQAVRETASALFWLSTSDTAHEVGCSRQMLSRRKRQIREALLTAGITSTYFVSTGSRA